MGLVEKWRTKGLVLALLCLLFLLPIGPPALAAEPVDLVVSPLPSFSQGKGSPAPEVQIWFSGKKSTYYLFLPAMAEGGAYTVRYTNVASLSLNGQALQSGGTTDQMVPGQALEMQAGKRSYTLQVMQSARLPALWITTESGGLEYLHKRREHEEPGSLLLLDSGGQVAYEGRLSQVKGRGNATFQHPKKPYQIKLEESTNLLGMGKAKTWLLLAEYNDYSLLRNTITFGMATRVGLPYTSKSQHVDVYVNREYLGTYLLCEKVQIGESRLNIDDLEKTTQAVNAQPLSDYPRRGQRKYKANTWKGYAIPENPVDITGGYLLEWENTIRYPPEASGFVTRAGQAVVVKEPEFASEAQMAYIRGFVQGFENALRAESGIDSVSGKHYSAFVDMDSLVKKYLIEEISKNLDANKSSQYFYKPADSQSVTAFAGPVWDYDSSYGNYAKAYNKTLAYPTRLSAATDSARSYYLWPNAYQHEDFRQAVKEAFFRDFVPALRILIGEEKDPTGQLRSLEEYQAFIEDSAAMNRARWPIYKESSHPVDTGKTLGENVEYLRGFLSKRLEFLSQEWGK